MLNQTVPLDRTFHALSDPSRKLMVERLSQGPASVSELARPLDVISLPAVVQHLQVLEDSGLVHSEGGAGAHLPDRRCRTPARRAVDGRAARVLGSAASIGWATYLR